MIFFFFIPPVIAAMCMAWAYTHRDDDRLVDMGSPRHLAQ